MAWVDDRPMYLRVLFALAVPPLVRSEARILFKEVLERAGQPEKEFLSAEVPVAATKLSCGTVVSLVQELNI